MTQPKFAPILPEDEVRELYKLAAPAPWQPDRPADFRPDPTSPRRPGRGTPGPDQGYAMLLAERLADRLVLTEGEDEKDVLAGACVIAIGRAALFGRAPVTADLELALDLFGFLGEASPEVVTERRSLFGGVAHDYWRGRELSDLLPESTLRLSLDELAEALAGESGSFSRLAGLSE